MIHNYNSHWLGRIWICWDPGITSINLVSSHSQVITCQGENGTSGGPWILSIVYGANKGPNRRFMKRVKDSLNKISWQIAGDFNVIRNQQEKWG